MHFPRRSGILLHITSLPGGAGIGDLGMEAERFIEELSASGQKIWQILPLGPPAEGNSPYSAYSAFAGNPWMLSLELLAADGLLEASEVSAANDSFAQDPATPVDFLRVAHVKAPLLRKCFERFAVSADAALINAKEHFESEHAHWLEDFARFEALMGHFQERNWSRWPAELVRREAEALATWDQTLRREIEFAKFIQFLFERQWQRVKSQANQAGIAIYGDMPIFVAYESADVWANQEQFCVDENGKPTLVAGVPPDYFSKTGQLWGNPLYRWDVLKATRYDWWKRRFASDLRRFDLLRIDHFRGFEAYWEIPANAKTAVSGKWRTGPGAEPFLAAREALGELPFIAEDLGLITDEVHELRQQLDFPGMRVLQFGFDLIEDDFHRPNSFPQHSVAYTGTHDNETLVGWLRSRKPQSKPDPLATWLVGDEPKHWQLIRAVLTSKSDTAIIPMQDVLGLGNEARMNVPGRARGNWDWRLASGEFDSQTCQRLRDVTEASDR